MARRTNKKQQLERINNENAENGSVKPSSAKLVDRSVDRSMDRSLERSVDSSFTIYQDDNLNSTKNNPSSENTLKTKPAIQPTAPVGYKSRDPKEMLGYLKLVHPFVYYIDTIHPLSTLMVTSFPLRKFAQLRWGRL
jgi:hypothetical protein